MGAHLGLHLKNEQKTNFRQLRVNWFGNIGLGMTIKFNMIHIVNAIIKM